MPELPDVELYLKALRIRTQGTILERIRLASPFLVRSVAPPIHEAHGRRVLSLQRLGKRIVFDLEGETHLVLHLMIAGRLHWKKKGAKLAGKVGLAAFDFDCGSLTLTEAGSKKRASLYYVENSSDLQEHDPGGREVAALTAAEFSKQLTAKNHTLKRVLTDPRIFSGIGNAYSDEILHRAKLSPVQLSQNLKAAEIRRLFQATNRVLQEWVSHLEQEVGDGFPEKVTAFRPTMAVHGKYGKPCPVCETPIQRIVYASNETNYCPACQTGGKLLADRVLSKLLRQDWPKSLEEFEERQRRLREP